MSRGIYKQISLALRAGSRLCDFIFSYILMTHYFQKQTRKRLSFKTQFKIAFLLPSTDSAKVLEKMPDAIYLKELCSILIGFVAVNHLNNIYFL